MLKRFNLHFNGWESLSRTGLGAALEGVFAMAMLIWLLFAVT